MIRFILFFILMVLVTHSYSFEKKLEITDFENKSNIIHFKGVTENIDIHCFETIRPKIVKDDERYKLYLIINTNDDCAMIQSEENFKYYDFDVFLDLKMLIPKAHKGGTLQLWVEDLSSVLDIKVENHQKNTLSINTFSKGVLKKDHSTNEFYLLSSKTTIPLHILVHSLAWNKYVNQNVIVGSWYPQLKLMMWEKEENLPQSNSLFFIMNTHPDN